MPVGERYIIEQARTLMSHQIPKKEIAAKNKTGGAFRNRKICGHS